MPKKGTTRGTTIHAPLTTIHAPLTTTLLQLDCRPLSRFPLRRSTCLRGHSQRMSEGRGVWKIRTNSDIGGRGGGG